MEKHQEHPATAALVEPGEGHKAQERDDAHADWYGTAVLVQRPTGTAPAARKPKQLEGWAHTQCHPPLHFLQVLRAEEVFLHTTAFRPRRCSDSTSAATSMSKSEGVVSVCPAAWQQARHAQPLQNPKRQLRCQWTSGGTTLDSGKWGPGPNSEGWVRGLEWGNVAHTSAHLGKGARDRDESNPEDEQGP